MEKNKSKKGLSIKIKMMLVFALILFVSVFTLTYSSSNQVKKEMDEVFLITAKENIHILDKVINDSIKKSTELVEYSSSQIGAVKNDVDRKLIMEHLTTTTNSSSEILDSYVAYNNKSIIFSTPTAMPEGYDPTTRPWYIEAVENKGKVIITNPYIDAGTQKAVITIAKTNKDNSGVFAIDMEVNFLAEIFNNVKIGEKGYTFVLDEKGVNMIHPEFELGQDLSKENGIKEIFQSENKEGKYAYTVEKSEKNVYYSQNKLTGWIIGANYDSEEVSALAKPVVKYGVIIGIIILLISLTILYFTISMFIKPIIRLKEVAEKVAEGDLTERITIASNDEIGQLGESFNKMTLNLNQIIDSISETSTDLASFSDELSASTDENSRSIKQIAESIQEVSNGSNEQLKSTSNVSRVINDMGEEINSVSTIVDGVTRSSQSTSEKATSGVNVVKEAITQIDKVKDSVKNTEKDFNELISLANEISKFSSTISEIAQQTNLLALNAAIEAAHAGEHGKGFAVVSEEIRKLAEESGGAAKKIQELIETIQKSSQNASKSMSFSSETVEQGSKKVSEAGNTFGEIEKMITDLAVEMKNVQVAVENIKNGTEEMVLSFTEISNVSEEITSSIDNVASVTEEQNSSMDEISAASTQLSQKARDLKDTIEKFKK